MFSSWGCGLFSEGGPWRILGMGIQLFFWIVLIASLIYIFRQIGSRVLIRRITGQDQPYAAISDQRKTEINALNNQMAETQKQIVDKYAEAGEIYKAQADAIKDPHNAVALRR